MIDRSYYDRLEIDPSASFDEVKVAYHRAAKKFHPDLFPDGERDRLQLSMMKINEAYMRIMQSRARQTGVNASVAADHSPGADTDPSSATDEAEAGTLRTALAHPRDPAYTHYKLGFVFYTRGCTQLYRKDPKIIRRQLAELKTYNYYVLDLALKALSSFERAYNYFLVVVEQYPQSIWVSDAHTKLRRIQRFNDIYHRICENTAKSLAARERDPPETGGQVMSVSGGDPPAEGEETPPIPS